MEQKHRDEYFWFEGPEDEEEDVAVVQGLTLRFSVDELLVVLGDQLAESDRGIFYPDLFEVFGADALLLGGELVDLLRDVGQVLQSMEEDGVSLEWVVAIFEVIGVLQLVLCEMVKIIAEKVHLL